MIGASHLLLCRDYSAEMEAEVAAHFPPFLSVVGQMDHLCHRELSLLMAAVILGSTFDGSD